MKIYLPIIRNYQLVDSTFINSHSSLLIVRDVMKKIYLIMFFILSSVISLKAQWYPQTSGTTSWLWDVCFVDSINGWIASDDGIIHTTNGGINWYAQPNSDTLHAVFFVDNNCGWAVGSSGNIVYTTNGGNNWVQQASGTTALLSGLYFTSLDSGIIVGAGGVILRTTDGGNNWTIQNSPTLKNLNAVWFTDENNGISVGNDAVLPSYTPTILRTTDGGVTWISQTPGVSFLFTNLWDVCFTDANNGFAAGSEADSYPGNQSQGLILKTTDGGTSWSVILQDSSVHWFRGISFADANNGIVVGTNGKIIRTTDGGENWFSQVSNTTNWLNSIDFSDINHATVAGTIGTILRYSISSTVVNPTEVSAESISDSNMNISFIPNASSDNVVIVWNLTGTFTIPGGTPPGVDSSFAGGTVLYNGLTSPVSHTGLAPSTVYYYKLFSYNGTYYSTGVAVSDTTLPLLDPSEVASTAISNTQIRVSFTPNASNDNVVIVWNLTGTFTTPSGTPPAADSSFAGGAVLYNGLTSPVNHTGLAPSTVYYYKLFSYNGTYYSTGVTVSDTTLPLPDPSEVASTAISDTQIRVSFTPNASNDNIVIVWNLTGTFTTPGGTPPAVDSSFAGGTVLYNGLTSPVSHTGLAPSTVYYYKLFSYNGLAYSSGVTTNTATNAASVNPPYVQDFEGTFPPTGWTNYGTKTWSQSTGGMNGTMCAHVSYSPAGTANLQMPSLVLPASPNYRIKFWWKDNDVLSMMNEKKGKQNNKEKENSKSKQKGIKHSGDGIEIAGYDTTFFEISTNGGTNWTVLAFLSTVLPQSGYSEVIQNLDSYAGQTISIRWHDWSDGTFNAYGTGLDNITVEEIPACSDPTGLTATDITNNSANIGWSGAAIVDIDYGTPGHLAGTGTVINSVNSVSYTLDSLTASTSYDVYIRHNCSSVSFSNWAGPLSFTTACNIAIAPWIEGLESGVFPPTCWTVGSNIWGTSGSGISGYGNGSYCALADFYGVSSGSDNLVSFGYDASGLTNPQLKFDWAYSTYTGEVDEMDIYYSTNSGSNWTLLLAMPGGTNGILNPYHLVNSGIFVPTTGQWSTQSLALPAGSNMVKFAAISAYGNELYLDNIKVQEIPSIPIFSLSPISKDFGSVYVGLSSANQTFTITNTGTGTLTITAGNISIVGTDNNQFVLTNINPYPINLTAGQSTSVDVSFSPASTGAKIADLQIVDNLTDATHTAPLIGVGATPPAVPYFEDFETFVAGQQLACLDPVNWMTWSNLPCDTVEDPFISTSYAFSGTNSAKIVQNNDLVRPLVSQTLGKWLISFMLYIPTGKAGYFNTLAIFGGENSNWGMECYFDSGGGGRLFAGSATVTNFTWVDGSWQMVQLVVDLNIDSAKFYYRGTMIKGWQWTLGANGTGCPLQLDANDFFGATINDEMYLDNYSFQPFTNTFQLTVNVNNGWNMVSVPGLNSPDQNVNTWWPNRDLNTDVFKYLDGYQSIATTTTGIGYWMKNDGDQTYNTGDEWPAGGIQIVPHNPISAASGWNIFGGYENTVDATALTTTPSEQIVYPIYEFIPSAGYQVATQIAPGYGYWVKVLSTCQINIPDVMMAKGKQKPTEYFKDYLPTGQTGWGKITLTDAGGCSYTLYSVKGEVDLNQYELPPLPPSGIFDVRYSSGRVAEDINSEFKTISMSGIIYPVRVKVENMDIRLQDVTGKELNVYVKKGEEITISNPNIDKLMVIGQLTPDKYALEQNFPNPFNPNTTIRFSILKEVQVNLSVYNILGEKVKELKNEVMKPGYYEVEFNASLLASGVYLYRIKTGDFVQTKKMILMK